MRFGWLWLCALGCTGSTPEPAPPEPPPTPGRSVTVEPEPASDGSSGSALQINAGDAVPVQLRFTTVGALHQGYFGQPKLVQRLGKGLGQCTTHTVDVDVVWSQKDLEGRIIGVVPAQTIGCLPTRSGDTVDLRPLVPMTQALARYRDNVAGTSDFRIANFVVGLDLARAGQVCRVTITGQHPPDGTRFDPCVSVNGVQACAAAGDGNGVQALRFTDPTAAKLARSCFAD